MGTSSLILYSFCSRKRLQVMYFLLLISWNMGSLDLLIQDLQTMGSFLELFSLNISMMDSLWFGFWLPGNNTENEACKDGGAGYRLEGIWLFRKVWLPLPCSQRYLWISWNSNIGFLRYVVLTYFLPLLCYSDRFTTIFPFPTQRCTPCLLVEEHPRPNCNL